MPVHGIQMRKQRFDEKKQSHPSCPSTPYRWCAPKASFDLPPMGKGGWVMWKLLQLPAVILTQILQDQGQPLQKSLISKTQISAAGALSERTNVRIRVWSWKCFRSKSEEGTLSSFCCYGLAPHKGLWFYDATENFLISQELSICKVSFWRQRRTKQISSKYTFGTSSIHFFPFKEKRKALFAIIFLKHYRNSATILYLAFKLSWSKLLCPKREQRTF